MDAFLTAGDQRDGAVARTVDDGAAAGREDAVVTVDVAGSAADRSEVADRSFAVEADRGANWVL